MTLRSMKSWLGRVEYVGLYLVQHIAHDVLGQLRRGTKGQLRRGTKILRVLVVTKVGSSTLQVITL